MSKADTFWQGAFRFGSGAVGGLSAFAAAHQLKLAFAINGSGTASSSEISAWGKFWGKKGPKRGAAWTKLFVKDKLDKFIKETDIGKNLFGEDFDLDELGIDIMFDTSWAKNKPEIAAGWGPFAGVRNHSQTARDTVYNNFDALRNSFGNIMIRLNPNIQYDDIKIAGSVIHEIFEIHMMRREFSDIQFIGEDILYYTLSKPPGFGGGIFHQGAVNLQVQFEKWLKETGGI